MERRLFLMIFRMLFRLINFWRNIFFWLIIFYFNHIFLRFIPWAQIIKQISNRWPWRMIDISILRRPWRIVHSIHRLLLDDELLHIRHFRNHRSSEKSLVRFQSFSLLPLHDRLPKPLNLDAHAVDHHLCGLNFVSAFLAHHLLALVNLISLLHKVHLIFGRFNLFLWMRLFKT